MISSLISRLVILFFGTLYPAYASYKAVRSKDLKEYIKWMMYWIVFAIFTCAETFTDLLFAFWFPFYYEIKIGLVLWLLSPVTKGSTFLYKTFVHPALLKREEEIDEMLAKAKERGYSTVLRIGSQGVTYATNVILQTAMKGGGGLVEHLRKSYSLSDLGPERNERYLRGDEADSAQVLEEEEDVAPRPVQRGRRPQCHLDMKFKEVDVNMTKMDHSSTPFKNIQSTEDISSGYSSTDQLFMGQSEQTLSRAGSTTSRGRGRQSRVTQQRRAPLTEEPGDGGEGDMSSESSPTRYFDSFPLPDSPSGVVPSSFSTLRKFSVPEVRLDEARRGSVIATETPEARSLLVPEEGTLNGSQTSIGSSSSDKSLRKGKYGKYPAPRPPPDETRSPAFSDNDKPYESTV